MLCAFDHKTNHSKARVKRKAPAASGQCPGERESTGLGVVGACREDAVGWLGVWEATARFQAGTHCDSTACS